jgi:DNA-binding NtrC family response regulator
MAYEVIHRPKGPIRERLLLIGGFTHEFYAILRKTDLFVEEVFNGKEALDCAAQREYGVAICSLRMDGAWGMDVLDAILKADPLTPVIMSTHEQSPRVVVEAMQRRAFDYMVEPYKDLHEVMATIERAVQRRATLREGRAVRETLASGGARFFEQLVGKSAVLRELCERIRQAGPSHSPVLLEGESGTGKELAARAVHNASNRRMGPFVAVHCGAIPENLLESELFGHEKGSFTGADSTRVGVFEEAHGGTLFLDEIGLTSRACQARLLRVLESGAIRRVGASREFNVDVRIVAATNEPLDQLAAAKTFRHDLLYRLNVVTLRLPALRERPEDIPLLCYHFAERFAREAGKPFEAFSPEALETLGSHAFPGNVRELRNIIDRAVVFSRGPVIGLTDLPDTFRLPGHGHSVSSESTARPANIVRAVEDLPDTGLDGRLRAIEKAVIENALLRVGHNRSRAARLLKINRTTLLEKITRLKIHSEIEAKSARVAKPERSQRPKKARKAKIR